MRKLASVISAFFAFSILSSAQEVDLDKEFFALPDSITNEYLDSLKLSVAAPNNYWLVGAFGGLSAQVGYFNPSRNTAFQMQYPVYGVSFIKYYSMFGVFPNMGVEFGAQQNYEGYLFGENSETQVRSTESGAYKVMMNVPEAFFLTHLHYDIGEHFKLQLKIGLYAGYRLKIERVLDERYQGQEEYEQYRYAFRDYDRRFTYGLQGGLGFALMFSPIEIHANVQVKWGWEPFWNPDYASPYYYRFGYPLDGVVNLGVYYQLTPRYGHTRAQLKRLAKKMIQESKQ